MSSTAIGLIEFGGILLVLGMLARLSQRLTISPIPLYLLGGLAFGTGGIIPLSGIHDFTEVAAEIGVVLLLFMLGLEYSPQELVTGMRRSWVAGVGDLLLNATPGVIVALLLGWGGVGAVVLGGVTYISSSGIVAKVLNDLGQLGNRETPAVLSILVFEDLAMAVYLPVLTTILAGASFISGFRTVALALVVVAIVLFAALKWGNRLSVLLDSPNPEIFLLSTFGGVLLVAGAASLMQVSAAVGAFLFGIAISGSTADTAMRTLAPLRDLFAAVFFVVFGLNTDPRQFPAVIAIAVVLALITVGTKLLTGVWAAARAGVRWRGRVRAGAALIARGEFSIVIAGLGVAAGSVDDRLAPLVATYVLIMAVCGPVVARFAASTSQLPTVHDRV